MPPEEAHAHCAELGADGVVGRAATGVSRLHCGVVRGDRGAGLRTYTASGRIFQLCNILNEIETNRLQNITYFGVIEH